MSYKITLSEDGNEAKITECSTLELTSLFSNLVGEVCSDCFSTPVGRTMARVQSMAIGYALSEHRIASSVARVAKELGYSGSGYGTRNALKAYTQVMRDRIPRLHTATARLNPFSM